MTAKARQACNRDRLEAYPTKTTGWKPVLREDLLHRVMFFDTREPEIQAAEAEVEPSVVEAQAVQDRSLDVVNMDGSFDDVKPQFVGAA